MSNASSLSSRLFKKSFSNRIENFFFSFNVGEDIWLVSRLIIHLDVCMHLLIYHCFLRQFFPQAFFPNIVVVANTCWNHMTICLFVWSMLENHSTTNLLTQNYRLESDVLVRECDRQASISSWLNCAHFTVDVCSFRAAAFENTKGFIRLMAKNLLISVFQNNKSRTPVGTGNYYSFGILLI